MTTQRLSKVLAGHGVASRRGCEQLIFSRRVRVNGHIVLEPQTPVDPSSDDILIDLKPLPKAASKLYLMFHKPKGMICSHQRQSNNKLIYDSFTSNSERLFSVGRLDKDTSGLLLMTNDGHFAHQITHPSFKISKEYLVKTNHEISDEHLKTIQQGALVEGKWVKPLKVQKVRRGTLKIVVHDGRKREVRCLVEAAFLKVLDLKRIRIGNLCLDSLQEGCYRPLTPKELDQLLNLQKV
ncbi:MAG: rRNA pseudouridine synthase [Chlamydiae bacterium]|nr:rRNA pseudouridine synthase [Chlamydiota bacterium]